MDTLLPTPISANIQILWLVQNIWTSQDLFLRIDSLAGIQKATLDMLRGSCKLNGNLKKNFIEVGFVLS